MLNTDGMQTIQSRLIGYCDLTRKQIVTAYLANDLLGILNARGNFAITINDGAKTTILTSRGGLICYYYAVASGILYHGETVQTVFHLSGISWQWNYSCLADYLTLGHTLGSDTLHPMIFRLPAGSILTFHAGNVLLQDHLPKPAQQHATPGEVLDSLVEEVLYWWSPDTDMLCLSGGLDSRLLLSILLNAGQSPLLLVCGEPGSFDLTMSRRIARQFSLKLVECTIKAEDLVANHKSIVCQTNGLLPVTHWPGILFAQHAKERRLFLGFNGEVARSFYDNNGYTALVRSRSNPHGRLANNLLANRSSLVPSQRVLSMMHPSLAVNLSQDAGRSRTKRLMNAELNMADAFDFAFASEYTTHKTGADIAALSCFARTISPFASDRWTERARGLSRSWKINSHFHKWAIGKMQPSLLDFPEEKYPSVNISSRNIISDAITLHKQLPVRHFFDQAEYLQPSLIELLDGSIGFMDKIFDPMFLRGLTNDSTSKNLYYQLSTLGIWVNLALARREI